MLKFTIGAIACLCVAGCTSYTPLPSPRIAEVTTGYAKDGRIIPRGFYDSGLIEAVRGDPEAESQASTYRGLTIAGSVLDLVSAGLLVGGTFQ